MPLDGILSNLFVVAPAVILVSGVYSLARKGFFGPHQR